MCPVERRPNERAMHETYLVIKAAPTDMGSRPLSGPFATPEVTVGPDGRPRAVVWNLGTREVQGVTTEFAYVPAGLPIRPENVRVIGQGNPANIGANSSVAVPCTAPWRRTSMADVLLVSAFHDSDPIKAAYDPLIDRHVGQMNYNWAGVYEGKVAGGQTGFKIKVDIKPANKGLYRVRMFQAVDGRMSSLAQIDRIMAPNGATFRWLEIMGAKRDDWEMIIVDNQKMNIRCRIRYTDGSGRTEPDLIGSIERT